MPGPVSPGLARDAYTARLIYSLFYVFDNHMLVTKFHFVLFVFFTKHKQFDFHCINYRQL